MKIIVAKEATERISYPRRAFTLIELLVVIAIIAILAAMLLPGPIQSQGESQCHQLHQQFEATHAGSARVRG